MTPDQQEKTQLRISSLQNAITINQQLSTGKDGAGDAEEVITAAKLIYEYLTAEIKDQSPLIGISNKLPN